MRYKVEGGMIPPAIANISGKHYIVPFWIEVDSTTTLDDIDWKKDESYTITREVIATFPSSSSPDITYKVEKTSKGDLYCDCPGFVFKKKCKHTKQTTNA
jgi:hypothetical protein